MLRKAAHVKEHKIQPLFGLDVCMIHRVYMQLILDNNTPISIITWLLGKLKRFETDVKLNQTFKCAPFDKTYTLYVWIGMSIQ